MIEKLGISLLCNTNFVNMFFVENFILLMVSFISCLLKYPANTTVPKALLRECRHRRKCSCRQRNTKHKPIAHAKETHTHTVLVIIKLKK